MNTNKLKSFAKEARIILLQGVTQRLAYWGFDKNGNVKEELESIEGGYIFRDDVFNDPSVPAKWNRLKIAINRHTPEDIIEEAAYTWFNRLIAIKILEKNNYVEPVISYVSSELADPVLLDNARKGEVNGLTANEKSLLQSLILDGDKDEEAFGLLLTAYCRNDKLLKRIFGHIDDYTELLLPTNLLSGGGIIEQINNSDAIANDDYKEVELIGWLYQFYISDKKDEIFAGFKKKKKARAEDIPAATQIFTPKWIVKYMVENTIGNIWLDKNPQSSIKNEMKYLVEPADKENYKPDMSGEAQLLGAETEPIINDVTELTLLDPACGSGHILVVAFDLLMKIYIEEGYSTRQAAEAVINNNLYGLDIDDRAAQLANFAILLKAASYFPGILEKDIEPNIFSMPEPKEFSLQDIYDFLGEEGKEFAEELQTTLNEMRLAKNVGSALKINLSDTAKTFIAERNKEERELTFFNNLKPFVNVILILSSKFHSVVANPPYMGQKNMNADLKNYINKNYPVSKSDLFAVFMEVCWNRLPRKGLMGMINQHSWMFLSSYEKLRNEVLAKFQIVSMLHLGPGTFKEISGEVVQSTAFVLKNDLTNKNGTYHRLVELSSDEKENGFLSGEYAYPNIPQTNFAKIPGSPIAYWVNYSITKIFTDYKPLYSYVDAKIGLSTGENDRYLRYWFEIIVFDKNSKKNRFSDKWYKYDKGGENRKWYGNKIFVVNWKDSGRDIKLNLNSVIRNEKHYFKQSVQWSRIAAGKISARFSEDESVFDVNSASIFTSKENLLIFIALLNSKVSIKFLEIFSPTLTFQVGDVSKIPVAYKNMKTKTDNIKVDSNIVIAKSDWDSRETSWDFKQNELIRLSENGLLEKAYNNYTAYWKEQFFQLHKNEEELNRIFIDIYGLQDELTPDVELKDITILQEETYIEDNSRLLFKQDVVIQQLLSYAIGCFMGRYRLDKEGLQIAHPNPTEDEIAPYKITTPLKNGSKETEFQIDDDAIIPMLGSYSAFSDDVYLRVKHFIEIVWGVDNLTENLNFINQSLNMELEKYLTEKFWGYHCKAYKKRPIYWLFSSPKGAFKVLVYMHRMNKYTVQKIRNNYLIKHLGYLGNQIERLGKETSSLTREEAKKLDKLRTDEIECREYDKLLKVYADKQIEFDLDDGVKVNYELFKGVLAKIK